MKAWHFVGDTLRDGRPVPKNGETLVHDGELVLCESGLHASRRLIDALWYAPGHTICRVEMGGEIIEGEDKLVATERTILWRIDDEDLLREFARRCALDLVHVWDAPDIVVRYLKTGDESIKAAARYAAMDAAGAAAWAAAGDAARYAAIDAAGAAAWAAAQSASQSAAQSVAWAARGAGSYAAWVAAKDKQNRRLTAMVTRAR